MKAPNISQNEEANQKRLAGLVGKLNRPGSEIVPAWDRDFAASAAGHWAYRAGLPAYYFDRCTDDEVVAHMRLAFTAWSQTDSPLLAHTQAGAHQVFLADPAHQFEAEERLEQLSEPGLRVWNWSSYRIHSPTGQTAHLIIGEGAPDQSDADGAVTTPWVARGGSREMRRRYQDLRREVLKRGTLVVKADGRSAQGEYRILIGFPRHALRHFLANVTRSLERAQLSVPRKYAAGFGGAQPVYAHVVYTKEPLPPGLLPDLVAVGLYPPGTLGNAVDRRELSPELANFHDAAAFFVGQFSHKKDMEIEALAPRLSGEGSAELLHRLERRVDQDHFPREAVLNSFLSHPEIMGKAFALFKKKITGPGAWDHDLKALVQTLATRIPREDHRLCLEGALHFVRAVTRSNFFRSQKSSLVFSLNPGALPLRGGTPPPHSVLLLSSKDFYGFHVRFAEVARGGVRLIRSGDEDRLAANTRGLFDECLGLAYTQHRKNKDLPEGGAKGALVLRTAGAGTDAGVAAFKKYIDGLLDLCTGESDGPGAPPAMLFLGPDEGTAGLMDWAAERALARGLAHAHAFTTGKSTALGGISHHDFGITTAGVRTWARELYKRLGVSETRVSKVQTGGPDGDLGGNEILQGREITKAVVDGSGVLYDPRGLDPKALRLLAKARKPVGAWKGPLSRGGFLLRTEDRQTRLPDGRLVEDGVVFRNRFHLDPLFAADLFVPCGGRPASVGPVEAQGLLDAAGKPPWKWVVEGANLFFTPEGRHLLEKRGVLLFKDASVNKGGVTSSSLEVLCALGLGHQTWRRELTANTPFRRQFIAEVLNTVRLHAREEFAVLWDRRHLGPLSSLSDELSDAFLKILAEVEKSPLADNPKLLLASLARHLPPLLRPKIKSFTKALPPSYRQALAVRTLVRSFIYARGPEAGREVWREYVAAYVDGAP